MNYKLVIQVNLNMTRPIILIFFKYMCNDKDNSDVLLCRDPQSEYNDLIYYFIPYEKSSIKYHENFEARSQLLYI